MFRENQEEQNIRPGLDVAVIGMAGRFPGAKNVQEFWNNIKNGIESITFFSDQELAESGVTGEEMTMPDYVRAKGILEDLEYFDASFFGYSPKEAIKMDPQTRILHECVWHALEEAGYDPYSYGGSIGFYVGGQNNFYWQASIFFAGSGTPAERLDSLQLADKDHISTRISYKLNLTGPTFSMVTQCSTSLVAVHQACQGLLSAECEIALAGGISILLPHKTGYQYQEGMILSSDGHLRAFDARASGTVFGSGAGIVVLKLASDAVEDGDNIKAIIKSSFINNDGNRKVGYSAPSVEGQSEAIQSAMKLAEVEPESISYIETHGTATSLGDCIEIEAMKMAFETDKNNFCGIGTVKTNVGHLENAAGATGLIKTVLALQHKLIPPSLHFETPNPEIEFENSPFYVNVGLTEWKRNGYPLRAGVSNFGIGGTNAHLILEEAPQSPIRPSAVVISENEKEREYQLILLSARTKTALTKMADNLKDYLQENPGVELADVAYTLQVGRRKFHHRRAFVSATATEAVQTLGDPAKSKTCKAASNSKPVVIFMFPGLGSQYVNMGWELYQTEPLFREEMDRCFEILKSLLDYDIKEIFYPQEAVSGVSPEFHRAHTSHMTYIKDNHNINCFEIAQVVVFIFEYALARLIMAWGITPSAMIGYSFGEYTAACLSGVFSLADALKIIVSRGKLIEKMPAGAMLSVPLSQTELIPLLNNELSLAIDNGPSCIVSGPVAAVEAFEKQMKEIKHICVRLQASHALHSHMMEPISAEFAEIIAGVTLHKPQIPYISNVTGSWIPREEAPDPTYWSTHLCHTVRFAGGIKELLKESNTVCIEIGPGHDLSVLCRHHVDNEPGAVIMNLIKHSQEKIPDESYLLNRLGRLWMSGVEIDWQRFHDREKRKRISLPPYPFERLSYWLEGDPFKLSTGTPAKLSMGKKADITDWFYVPSWKYSPLPVTAGEKISKESCWLVFSDETGPGSQLVERLNHGGADIVTVRAGENFTRISRREYTINPGKNSDYNTLLEEFTEIGKVPDKILHLWSVGGDNNEPPAAHQIDEILTRGFYSLMYLAQAIGKRNYKNRIQITVITDNMQRVTGDEMISPGKAAVIGAIKVIPQEYYNIDCCSIDIAPAGNRQYENTIEQLLGECVKEFPDPVVAFRNNYRWVQIFEPLPLKKPTGKIPSRLKRNGVYLVTGGLGGIGYTMAGYLAETVQARLILTGRSVLPPRQEWEQWLNTHLEDDNLSRKIERALALEKLGSQVLVCSADISDYQQMKAAITTAEKKFGCINGVIHSAGLPDGGVIPLRTREMTDKILAPKIKGTMILDEVCKNIKLDFFIIFSSLASVVGGLGQLGYCAANAFQDAYAHYMSSGNGNPAVAIDWDFWKEVGFGIESLKQLVENNDIPESEAEFLIEHAISPPEGIDIFSRVLEYSFPQILISTKDVMDISELLHLQVSAAGGEESQLKARPAKLYPRPELSTEYVIPTTEFEITCADVLQQYFGFEKVGIHDNLFEFGVTSLEMIHINDRLNRELKKDIPLVIMFEFPTIHSLQQYLCQEETAENPEEESQKLDKEKTLLYDSINIFGQG